MYNVNKVNLHLSFRSYYKRFAYNREPVAFSAKPVAYTGKPVVTGKPVGFTVKRICLGNL